LIPFLEHDSIMGRLLLIDDDQRLTGMLGDYLRQAGHDVEVAHDLAQGRKSLAQHHFDALILDLMLPDGDGLDLCRELRAQPAHRMLPLLMLTARGDPLDRVVGLEMGADDYLGKPFEARELLARVKALLRRSAFPQGANSNANANLSRHGNSTGIGGVGSGNYYDHETSDSMLQFGRLDIDPSARQARLDGQVCDLTSYQFDLLLVLARAPGRVLSRDRIMDSLKGHPLEAFDRSIDVHVSRIRAVIEDDPKNPRRILTVRSVGYVFAKKQDVEQTVNAVAAHP
jgi:DNA-binding response OmpR family regulator